MIPVHYYFVLSIIFLSILTSIEAGLYLVLRYRTGLALWAGLILFSQALELVGYLLYWIKPTLTMVPFISLTQIFFYTLFCIFWLIFVFIFTRHSAWIRLRNLILIIALPCTYLPMMTALWIQGSVMDPTEIKIVGSLMLSPFTSGLPGSLFIIFVYGVAIFSSLVLLRFFSKSNPVLRMMALPLLVGPNLLALVAALELAGIHPIQPLSIHQLAIASITLIAFWAVFDLRFGSVLSSARETVIDQMQDGVLILDQQDRLIDINAAAQHILGSDSKNALKQNIIKIWPQGAALISGQSGTNFSIGETAIQVDGLEYTYDISISKLLDAYQETVGRVVVLRNITKRELMEQSLKERTQELQHTNAFLTAMAQAMNNIQGTTEPARVLDIMGSELYAMGLKCFIAQLEPDSEELVVSYLHTGENSLAGIGSLLGDRVIGYRLKRDRFLRLYKLVEGKENSYRDLLIKGISSFDDQEFSQKIKQIMGLIGLKLDVTTIVVRLVAGEQVLGLMGVWGDDLRETDVAPLNMFANQVAWSIEKASLYKTETRRSSELARVNSLVIALSKVATILGVTSNSDKLFDTLGSELKDLGLDCGIVTIDPDRDVATIEYLSFNHALLQTVEKLAGVSAKNYIIPKQYWPDDRAIQERIPVWYSDPGDMLRKMFPAIPNSIAKKALHMLGFKPETQLCMLPLIGRERAIGAILIWGVDLDPSDGAVFAIFASQVASVLQNAFAYELETRRTNELSLTNNIIMALAKVAARLDTTSDLMQVFETLGNELKKIRVNCMVGTFDQAKQEMKLEYLTTSNEITAWAEKLGAFWPKEITIPRHLWPTDNAVTDKAPYWDPDMIGSTARMFPYIHKDIFIRSFEMVGMDPNDPVCYLPMISEEDVIGILAVWGPDLRQEDIPGLSVFANQVATAIKNSRLYDQAQKEIITRTQAESRTRETLKEKEVLLKEVHHRVKNNLQIISSLLNLQKDQVKDIGTLQALRDSQSRVRSMALIHEKLYQSQSLAKIDFAEYVQSLTKDLFRSYQRTLGNIRLNIHADLISLDLDYAVPCGLILNELMTNTLKYAFPDGRDGSIWIDLHAEPDQSLILRVADDGIGLPAGLDNLKNKSLGLQLVNSLVKQINGTLVVESSSGTVFQVSFKV
jgi:PAS domain S-box-containing protein